MLYDMRFNLVTNILKHSKMSPIYSLAPFVPYREAQFPLLRSDHSSPLLFVAAGSERYEVTLVNAESGDVEMLFAVDDSKSKE